MRPGTTWFPSPNFNIVQKREISAVVIHATATAAIGSPKEWLSNPASKASAHYLIDRNGDTFQLVGDHNVAWHAGKSEWGGRKWVNNFSIGIELVNANDGKMDYPSEQIDACFTLTRDLCREYKVHLKNVVRHLDIAPGRKTDPAGFPWDDFKLRLHDNGVV